MMFVGYSKTGSFFVQSAVAMDELQRNVEKYEHGLKHLSAKWHGMKKERDDMKKERDELQEKVTRFQ